VIAAGAVGCNLEDVNGGKGTLRSKADAVKRIKMALKAAKNAGIPDFVVNARTDTLGFGGTLDEVIERARAYLAAGATTAFVWGGAKGRGLRTEEVRQLVDVLEGRLNVMMAIAPGMLTVPELRELDVARISVGPGMFFAAMKAFKDTAAMLLQNPG
jgi:2-methylisocitrate lyase-like PEP mutase family enzyme